MIKKIIFYRFARILICLFSILLIILGAVFLDSHRPGTPSLPMPCLTNSIFGLYCSGCGFSRCLYSILQLDFYQAFRYNELAFILLPIFIVYLLSSMVSFIITGKNVLNKHIPPKLLIGIFISLIIFAILRNIPFFPFNLLAPTVV